MSDSDGVVETVSYSWTSRRSSDSWKVVWRYDQNDLEDNDWKPYCTGSEIACREMMRLLSEDVELKEKNMMFGLVYESWSWELTDYSHVKKELGT